MVSALFVGAGATPSGKEGRRDSTAGIRATLLGVDGSMVTSVVGPSVGMKTDACTPAAHLGCFLHPSSTRSLAAGAHHCLVVLEPPNGATFVPHLLPVLESAREYHTIIDSEPWRGTALAPS